MYNFEWRWYCPITARTITMDPMAELFPHVSPYSWLLNNFVNRIDPDGRVVRCTEGEPDIEPNHHEIASGVIEGNNNPTFIFDGINTVENYVNAASFVVGGASLQAGRMLYDMRYYTPGVSTVRPTHNISRPTLQAASRGLNVAGRTLGITGLAITGGEILSGQKAFVGEGGLDLIMGGISMIPKFGWIVGGVYFGGKFILESTGNRFW